MRYPIVRALLVAAVGWIGLPVAAAPEVLFQPLHWSDDLSGFLALTADGTVRSGLWTSRFEGSSSFADNGNLCWYNGGQVNVPRETAWLIKGLYNAIAATPPYWYWPPGNHGAALDADGRVWLWHMVGYYDGNQGQTLPSAATPIPDVAGFKAITGRRLLLKQDGTVWRWFARETTGSKDYCQWRYTLGVQQVAGLDRVVAIASGAGADFALKSDGSLWAWGGNSVGQLGLGDLESRSTPTRIPSLDDIVAVFALSFAIYAAKADGSLWGWGSNGFSQLVGATAERSSQVPLPIPGIDRVKQMASDEEGRFIVALKHDGSVWAWGWNWGQLCADGDGPCPKPPMRYTAPVRLRGIGNNAIRVSASTTIYTGVLTTPYPPKHTTAIVHADGSITVTGAPPRGVRVDYGSSDLSVYALGRVTDLNLFKPPMLTDTDRILDWAEQTYRDLFAPAGSVNQSAAGYTYRYYRDSKSYLGTKNGRLWYLAPDAAPDRVMDAGSVAERLEEAKRAGY